MCIFNIRQRKRFWQYVCSFCYYYCFWKEVEKKIKQNYSKRLKQIDKIHENNIPYIVAARHDNDDLIWFSIVVLVFFRSPHARKWLSGGVEHNMYFMLSYTIDKNVCVDSTFLVRDILKSNTYISASNKLI